MKRRELEIALQSVPPFPNPNPDLEQYVTPATIAADLVWTAAQEGDIIGKSVLDLGCGTGILCKAAALLGAENVIGLDSDLEALQIAKNESPTTTFQQGQLPDWAPPKVDTVLMNPPFGAQKGNRKGDRIFYDCAFSSDAEAIWFLAPTVSQRFLASYGKERSYDLEKVLDWSYPLSPTMPFHTDQVRSISVGGYCFTK